jgi:hypothetical protein
VLSAGASPLAVDYVCEYPDATLAGQTTNGINLAGYMSWGAHSLLGSYYALTNEIIWNGNSRWWAIDTIESFNGQRYYTNNGPQGCFLYWFSANAFGGTNYSNTPVAAMSHVDEPGLFGMNVWNNYFGLWQQGLNFAQCAWISMPSVTDTSYGVVTIQATGDPFVRR